MAFVISLIVEHKELQRLLHICDSVKQLFDVTLIVNHKDLKNESNTASTARTLTQDKEAHKSSNSVGGNNGQQNSVGYNYNPNTTAQTQEQLSSVILQFESDGPPENIEKAKNFVKTHLSPNADYITCSHQLGNQEEFDMVFEHSRDIQTSTSALLTFNPDSLDVTFEGTSKSVAAARSKVVMILDQLRNPSGLEGGVSCPDEDSTTGHHFFGNFLVDPIADQDNNNVTSKMTFAVINDAEKSLDSEETNSRLVTKTIPDHKPHGPPLRSKMVRDDCEDIEVDSDGVYSPPARTLRKKISTSSSNTSSTDDESTSDENILTDPRYSKQIEQALKLGYAESLIRKALVKLGPNCELNDLLPELIASDSKHVDTLDSTQYLVGSKDSKRLIHSCSSGDSSSFSSSTDSPGGSFDNHRISGNSININDSDNLRDIIIDGSNVAMSHGKKLFSCKGIKIVVDWFRERGHKNITAFVPQWRKETSRPDAPISDQDILIDLEREGIVSFTPARRVKGKRMVCYDDRFVLNLAVDTDGIVVSNDVYRDLVNEKESFRKVVDERLLMYSFANDRFMPPEDPLGRLGPTLDNFLRKTPAEPSPKPQDCPYGKKCTYGNKCRFYHPERGFAPQKSITETLKEQAGLKLQEIATRRSELAEKGRPKQKLARTKSLVPGEPSPSLLSPTAFGEGQSRSEKPKLVHSKSQIATTKTSDYLNESRKKLEEAEMSAALEKMSMEKDAALFKKPHSHSVSYHQDYDVVSRTEETSLFPSSSPRMSPVPQKEAIKQKTTTADSTPPTNSPLKSSGSRSSRASPAHLTVPKQEPQEGYVSGHLLLAKKLSDESKEKFFSEHTSSPSSTRTTSPVMPVQSVAENKPHGTMENSPATCQGGQPVSSFAYPVAINPSLMAQHMASCYAGQDTIPNLSIFQSGAPLSTKLSDSDNIGNRHSSTDSGLVADYTSLQSPNSYSLSEPLSSPFQSHPDSPLPTIYQRQHQNYPVTGTDQLQQPLEHLNLRRSFSSTGSVAQSEDGHQKLGRRASGFAGVPVAGGHTMLKPQHSVPVSLRPGVPGMTRQNSTSDPQIHNLLGTSDMQGMFQGYGAADSAKKYQDLYSSQSQQYHGEPNQLQQQYQLQQQQQQQQLQRQLQLQQQYQRLHAHQQQESLMMGQPHTAKHNMGMWRDSVSHADQSRRASLGGGSRTGQFNPHHSPLPVQASSQQPHFQSEMDTAMMTPGSFYSNPMFSTPTSHYSQQMPHSPNYNAAPRSLSPQGLVQSSHSHTGYPFHQGMIQTNPVYGQSVSDQTMSAQSMPHMKQSRNLPPSHHSSLLGILPEDAPIEPNDPRYSLYYHLSNVFGEEVVRKVMNQNRSTTDPENLCKLIMEYKLRTGK